MSDRPKKKKFRITATVTSCERHHCHAVTCGKHVKPELLMCRGHWLMVPASIQRRVWATYRPGQCDDKQPSKEWHAAADAAICAVAHREWPRLAPPHKCVRTEVTDEPQRPRTSAARTIGPVSPHPQAKGAANHPDNDPAVRRPAGGESKAGEEMRRDTIADAIEDWARRRYREMAMARERGDCVRCRGRSGGVPTGGGLLCPECARLRSVWSCRR